MVRVKRGKAAHKRRKNVLKKTKGFRWGRKSKYKAAKEALLHAGKYAYRDRKTKKRNFRRLWQIQIGAACKEQGLSYNKFINGLKKNKIELDRKSLAELAKNNPMELERLRIEVMSICYEIQSDKLVRILKPKDQKESKDDKSPDYADSLMYFVTDCGRREIAMELV